MVPSYLSPFTTSFPHPSFTPSPLIPYYSLGVETRRGDERRGEERVYVYVYIGI
jgi:hypothetical protein